MNFNRINNALNTLSPDEKDMVMCALRNLITSNTIFPVWLNEYILAQDMAKDFLNLYDKKRKEEDKEYAELSESMK